MNIHRSQRVPPGNREDMERLGPVHHPQPVGLWVESPHDPPEPDEPIIEPWLDDPFPDYDHEPVCTQN